jgi:phosphatidylserine/phosphatidylglycerophosphate/cardiolipin synthase-like enzyme
MAAIDAFTLTDGGQTAESVARRVAGFIAAARTTLELALYDVRLPAPVGTIVADELRAAAGRGVRVRLLYNVDCGRPAALHPPPSTRPEILAELPIETAAISGIPDLMHHKYAVRDAEAVWTGSTNWTVDSWTRQENVIVTVDSPALAAAFGANFEELWGRRDVEHSGFVDPAPASAGGFEVRPWFTPGHGEDLSQRIASAIGAARNRVRIASPVITSAPVLGTLAELGTEGRVDVAGVVDEPQTETVFEQWRENGHTAWKIPLLATALERLPFSGKRSTPWSPESVHDFMHAKVAVADDTVFVGSFNLSRSGERNAENVLEIGDRGLADRMAAFVDQVRSLYPRVAVPEQARATIASGSSQSSAISKSSGEMRPSASSLARTQSSNPDQ